MTEPGRIIADYRSGTLTAETAALALLPLLQAAGSLELPLTEQDLPLLDALQRLSQPPLPPARPLAWDTPMWQTLDRMPDFLWPRIVENGEDQFPHHLSYVFLVGSESAARSLIAQVEGHTDHRVAAQLPDNFTRHAGRVFGRLPARMVTHADLVALAGWLRSLTPVEEATLEELHLSAPAPHSS